MDWFRLLIAAWVGAAAGVVLVAMWWAAAQLFGFAGPSEPDGVALVVLVSGLSVTVMSALLTIATFR